MNGDILVSKIQLPDQINRHLSGLEYNQNEIGCSQAKVYRFSCSQTSLYLKVEPKTGELDQEYKNLLWMQNKIPVPQIIEWYSDGEQNYLLLSEIKGQMMCDVDYLSRPELAVHILAEGINLLKEINIADCPLQNRLEEKFDKAEKNIQSGNVDMNDWEPSSSRFSSPHELLTYLKNNIPDYEECILTHGDYCLPNIIGVHNQLSGLIDVGRAGVADIWQDIALCLRSLRHNFSTDQYDELLLSQIGVSLNKEKLDYYTLLDELF